MPFTLHLDCPPSEEATDYLVSFGADFGWLVSHSSIDGDLFLTRGNTGHITATFPHAGRNHSVSIAVVGSNSRDPLMMVLQAILGPCLQPSFTGAAFVDWEDIKAALVSVGGDCFLDFSSNLSEARQGEAPPIIVVAYIGTERNALPCAREIYSRHQPDIFAIQPETRHSPRGILILEAR